MRELKKWGSKEKGARRRSPLRFPPSQHRNEKVRSEKQKKILEDQRWENWVKDSPLKTQNSKLKNLEQIRFRSRLGLSVGSWS